MFWKRKSAATAVASSAQAKEEVPKPKAEKPASQGITILTEAQILKKIEALTEPGSTVFFYLAGSPSSGGPLGRGAAVVELNPNFPGEKQKKYILYAADVDGLQPVGKGRRWFHSDKPKEIAKWIKERHYQPTGSY